MWTEGELHEALEVLERAVELTQRLFGDQHVGFAIALSNQAAMLEDLARHEEAVQILRKAESCLRRAYQSLPPPKKSALERQRLSDVQTALISAVRERFIPGPAMTSVHQVIPGLLLPRNCLNLTRISTPGELSRVYFYPGTVIT